MFRPFRFLRRRQASRVTPPDTEAEQASYDRAWADYVEWSGLDETGLPDTPRTGEQP